MEKRWIRWFLDKTPTLPDSLAQSPDNPIQVDRLADSQPLRTEFLASPPKRYETWTLLRWPLIYLILFALLRSIPDYFVPRVWALDLFGFMASLALSIATIYLIGPPRKLRHFFLYLIVLPVLIATTVFLRSAFFLLVTAAFFTTFVADRFATHVLYIGTASPFQRDAAQQLRRHWTRRFRPTLSTGRGFEFYPLLFLFLLFTPWLYLRLIPDQDDPSNDFYIIRTIALFVLAAIIVFSPAIVELLSALFYRRRPLPIRLVWKAYKRTLFDWLTYNHKGVTAPGLLQSPAGSQKSRLVVFFAVIYLWTATINPFVSYRIPLKSPLRTALAPVATSEDEPLETPDESPPDTHTDPEGESFLFRILRPVMPYLQFRIKPIEAPITFMFIVISIFVVMREVFLISLAVILPLTFFYALSARISTSLRQQLETHPDTLLSFGNWNLFVDDVASSDNPTEQKSLFLGVNARDNSPVVVPRSVFEEHAHLLGDSGSGKTSMGISVLLNQLMRHDDCSVVVIDLKADDNALFRGTQIDAEAAGKPFRWFTNELGKSTFAFNPLAQEYFQALSLYQKTDVLTAAMGLQYGTDYGRAFFSDANAEYLYRAFQANPSLSSFHQLATLFSTGKSQIQASTELRKAATHIVSVTQRLAATDSLNVTEQSDAPPDVIEQQIDFADLFRRPQVLYFHLPTAIGATTSAEIARVALYSLIGSARCTPPTERKQVFVFIDEFQRIVASNLELIMQTARSMGIGLILANQSMFDLASKDTDLASTVRTNTRFKQAFAASNIDEIRELIASSGEMLVRKRTFSTDLGYLFAMPAGVVRDTQIEATSARLRINDILMATDAPDQSIVQIRRGAGYAQYGGMPFIMRSTFHISRKEYEERKNSPWPQETPGTLISREVNPLSPLDALPPVDPILDDPQPATDSTSGSTPALPGLFDLAPPPNNAKKSSDPDHPS